MSDFLIAATFARGGLFDALVEAIATATGELSDAQAACYARQIVRHLRANGAFPAGTFEDVPTCPLCDGALDVQTDVVVDEPVVSAFAVTGALPERRTRVAAKVAFCNQCEFAKEL